MRLILQLSIVFLNPIAVSHDSLIKACKLIMDRLVISEISCVPRDWKGCNKIVFGIAQALKYLHEDCDPSILHRDIKPKNMLADYGKYSALLFWFEKCIFYIQLVIWVDMLTLIVLSCDTDCIPNTHVSDAYQKLKKKKYQFLRTGIPWGEAILY